MPLSFATILGGMATTIGTSTNLLVVNVAADLGMDPFGMFDFIGPVLIGGVLAILYLWLVVPLLYLAVMSAVRAVPILRFMNIVGALLLLALLYSLLSGALGFARLRNLEVDLDGVELAVLAGFLGLRLQSIGQVAKHVVDGQMHRKRRE